ncbi:hypothetical protein BC826DRAFT_968121 [Russula brevipes]|nr:hypothetical protein BC826DRAFT_968121 [Russula brevipes]
MTKFTWRPPRASAWGQITMTLRDLGAVISKELAPSGVTQRRSRNPMVRYRFDIESHIEGLHPMIPLTSADGIEGWTSSFRMELQSQVGVDKIGHPMNSLTLNQCGTRGFTKPQRSKGRALRSKWLGVAAEWRSEVHSRLSVREGEWRNTSTRASLGSIIIGEKRGGWSLVHIGTFVLLPGNQPGSGGAWTVERAPRCHETATRRFTTWQGHRKHPG